MKKVFIISEKGFVKEGYVKEEVKNMVGSVKVNGDKLKFADLEDENIIEIESIDTKLFDSNSLVKLITDNLPLEFHMYDLKTCLY